MFVQSMSGLLSVSFLRAYYLLNWTQPKSRCGAHHLRADTVFDDEKRPRHGVAFSLTIAVLLYIAVIARLQDIRIAVTSGYIWFLMSSHDACAQRPTAGSSHAF